MTPSRIWFPLLLVTAIALPSTAQVTNLKVNGVATGFLMTSGDEIRWEYDLPVGDSASLEIWYDVNANGTIEPATDFTYVWFVQVDGQVSGTKGPADMDSTANGHITFHGMRVGIAPGGYVIRVRCHGVGESAAGTVAPLPVPAHLLYGHVTPPPGKSAQYTVVEAYRSDEYAPSFWDAITDANGDFAIAMDSDTAGNPWLVEVSRNPHPPSIDQPDYRELTITGNHIGLDFSLVPAAAQVAGTVTNEFMTPLQASGVQLINPPTGFVREGSTDANGFYQVGVLAGELGAGLWIMQTTQPDTVTTDFMMGQSTIPIILAGDSIVRHLVVYRTDATIHGVVLIDGSPPGFPVTMMAANFDTASSSGPSEPGTGNFTLKVSSQISQYTIFPVKLPPNFVTETVVAPPGASGIVVNVTTTSVEGKGQETPAEFRLEQNYPNPFNPGTTIRFSLPQRSHVTLTVFNLLGQNVGTLVDETRDAGHHHALFDASGLASGVYLCRLQAGGFVQVRKMIVVK